MTLHAIILAIAALLGRGTPPPAVVDAIDTACTEEAERYPVDPEACAALVITYAAYESSYLVGVYGDSGRSYGLLQEPTRVARQLGTLEQVRWWIRALHVTTLGGLDSSPTRARRRERIAARALERAHVCTAGRYSLGSRPNVHATAARAVVMVGGTRSQ